jgi:Domain of Unknown Function (DUF1080)
MRLTFILALAFAQSALAAGDQAKRLFTGKDLVGWTVVDKSKSALWTVAGDVRLDPKNPKNLIASGEARDDKGVLVAQLKDFQGTNLVTTEKFKDFSLHVEFFLPKEGNSGIFLMGLYELQLTDSFGIADAKMQEGDHGGIPFFKKPLTNASLKPGEWQTAEVTFQAPRFDDKGKKTANAKIVKAVINGKTVQQNLELPEPTAGGLDQSESASGPIMLQGNEGPVGFRNVTITPQP